MVQPGAISKAVQLIAGRVGQEYNQRKGRKGAFWEDQYHAMAIQADDHLIRCLVYIDLNMFRAGAVDHSRRSGLIDYARLMELFQVTNKEDLRKAHRDWVNEAMANGSPFKDDLWTESVAVGDDDFVEEVKDRLGVKVKGRSIIKDEDQSLLRETQGVYLPC